MRKPFSFYVIEILAFVFQPIGRMLLDSSRNNKSRYVQGKRLIPLPFHIYLLLSSFRIFIPDRTVSILRMQLFAVFGDDVPV